MVYKCIFYSDHFATVKHGDGNMDDYGSDSKDNCSFSNVR